MQYAICLSSQAMASVFVFKFSRLSPTWTASVPSPHKASKPVLSNSSKPRFLSSITVFILKSRSIRTVLILYGEVILLYYMIKRDSLIVYILLNYIFNNLLFVFCKIGHHSVAQYDIKFTIIPLSQPLKNWEYSNEPYIQVYWDTSEWKQILIQIQYILHIHLL